MKVQIDGQHLRVRVDESEFARLLEWDSLTARTRLPRAEFVLCLRPVAGGPMALQTGPDGWRLDLPLPLLFDYRSRLPCRDGLDATQMLDDGTPLELSFEVDLRDSIRTRGPKRRAAGPSAR